MNIKKLLAGLIEEAVRSAVADGKLPAADFPPVKVEYPKEAKFGDYATPFALECARPLRKSPLEIGALLREYLQAADLVESVEVVKPGFINIFISRAWLEAMVGRIVSLGDEYGRNVREKPRTINIEFVSANPTGPLNIVSARAAAVGDTLANLMEMNGDIVDREFYVNDYGNQFMLLGTSVLARLRELRGEPFAFPEDGYHGEYIRDIAAHIGERFGDELARLADEEARIDFCAQKAVEYNVSGQKRDLDDFNVSFKNWFHERTLHEAGKVMQTLSFLESQKVIFDEEGKKVFRSTDFGDDKDRVVVRDDGRPTYLLADIAYHKSKIDRHYDLIVDIWGPDHHGYIARLAGAMKVMGCDEKCFRVLIAQQVNLIMEGEAVKMSKRLGRFSTMRELIADIGVDVARYFFIMRSLDSHLDFDLALAKRQSSENPVFYLQYAHARICSIFRKAQERGINHVPGALDHEALANDEALQLMKAMMSFPEEVADAAESMEPHRIANYLMRLAQAFHKFYTEHQVLSDDAVRTRTYLMLADATRKVMKNGLRLLGVTAPESM